MMIDPVTPEMIEAAENVEDLYKRGTPETWGKVYRAMRSAAPARDIALPLKVAHAANNVLREEVAILEKSIRQRELIGWVILDKDGVVHNFYPKTKHFYGSIEEDTAPTQEYLRLLDRDWAGLAPFTVKEVYHDTN